MSRIRLFVSLMGLCLLTRAHAVDTLVDNFQDGNVIQENWGNSLIVGAGGGVGQAGAVRSLAASPLNASNKDLQVTTTLAGNRAAQIGFRVPTGQGSIIPAAASFAGQPALQYIGMNIVRPTSNYDASSTRYVRFTSWLPTPVGTLAGGNITSANLIVSLQTSHTQTGAGSTTVPPAGVGPWDATGTNIVGYTLTQTPTVYLCRVNDGGVTFKRDPVIFGMLSAVLGTAPNIGPNAGGTGRGDWNQLKQIGFSYRRQGAPASSNGLGNIFFIDDIMLLDNAPGVTTTPLSRTVILESGTTSTATFTMQLNSMPSTNTTFTPTLTVPGRASISPASITFIPSGIPGPGQALWSTPVTFTISATDNGLVDGNANNIVVNFTSSGDLYYTQNPIGGGISFSVSDDDVSPSIITFGSAPATNNALRVVFSTAMLGADVTTNYSIVGSGLGSVAPNANPQTITPVGGNTYDLQFSGLFAESGTITLSTFNITDTFGNVLVVTSGDAAVPVEVSSFATE